MDIANYNFKPHRRGDTFAGLRLTYARNGTPVDLAGATIRMQLRRSLEERRVALDLSQGQTNGITLIDAAQGVFQLPAQVIDLPPHGYVYDIEIALSTGAVHTVMQGSWEIIPTVTR